MAVSGSSTQWEVINNDLCPRSPVTVFPRSPVSQHLHTYSYALGRVLGNIREGDQQIVKSEASFPHYCFSTLKNFSQKNPQTCALFFFPLLFPRCLLFFPFLSFKIIIPDCVLTLHGCVTSMGGAEGIFVNLEKKICSNEFIGMSYQTQG